MNKYPQLVFRSRFRRWQCGYSYKYEKNIINYYDCYHYDWKNGWVEIRDYRLPNVNCRTQEEAVENCTWHAEKNGFLKYLPHHIEPPGMRKARYKKLWDEASL